jgi:hypothetical protein
MSKGIANNRAVKIVYKNMLPKGALPGNVEPIEGKSGESCHEACRRTPSRQPQKGEDETSGMLACAPKEFYHLNSCRYLRRFFGKCRAGCLKITGGSDLSALLVGVPAATLNAAPGAKISGGENQNDGPRHVCWHHATNTGRGDDALSKMSSCAAKAEGVKRICPCADTSIRIKN